MNILKDKLEAYAVSTVEDTQKVSILDNFAISVEKAKEEADLNSQLKQGNILKDGKVSEDFCNCLFAILNHELKGKNNSIWRIAEILSPKETVHMIYRMNFKQSDKTRSEAWIRHSLNEGSMGSYFNLLIEGSNVLKDFYKPSAFVRDKTKMQSVQNLITYAISAIQFSINVEQVTSNHESLNLASSFEVVRSFTHGEQTNARRKPRGQASNIVTISDPEVFSNNGNEFESSTVKNQHSENQITLDDSVIHLNEKLTNMTVETSLGCNKCKTPEVDLIDHEKTKNTCTTIANPSSEPQNNKLIKTDQLIATPTNCIKNSSTENNLDRTCDESSSTIDENSPINLGSELFPNLNEGNYNNNCCNDNNYNDTKTGEIPLLSSVISSSSISNEHPITVKTTEFVPIHNTLSIMPTSTLIPSKTSAFCQVTKLNKLSVADNADNNFFSLANEQVEELFNYNSESFADSLLNNGIENEENDEIGSKMVLDHFGYKKNADGEVGDKFNSVNGINDSEHVSNVLEINKPLPEMHYVPGILTNENVVESSSQVKAEKPSYLSTVLSNEPKYSSQSLISKNAKISTVSKSFEQQNYITDSDSDTCSSSDRSFSILAELGISDSFIGLKEDYFSSPESFMGFSSQ